MDVFNKPVAEEWMEHFKMSAFDRNVSNRTEVSISDKLGFSLTTGL
jgi:hypothetical protein